MDIIQTALQIYETGQRKVKVTYDNGSTGTLRIFKSQSGVLAYYGRRMRRRGYSFPPYGVVQVSAIAKTSRTKTKQQKWRDGWNKVLIKLKRSGLWEHIVEDAEKAFVIGYDKLQDAYTLYWQTPHDLLVSVFQEHYPELIAINEQGKPFVDTSILWTFANFPRVKKMRFSKYDNDARLQRIQQALDAKKEHHESGVYGYDISFEYNPNKNIAFYSEQFRGCGNGHYYLALNATHALFSEDD